MNIVHGPRFRIGTRLPLCDLDHTASSAPTSWIPLKVPAIAASVNDKAEQERRYVTVEGLHLIMVVLLTNEKRVFTYFVVKTDLLN